MRQEDKRITSPLEASDLEGTPAEGMAGATPTDEIYLSVVIPAYNEAARLPTTIDKVMGYLASRPYPHEVIVVDDGSADSTASIVDEATERYPELRVIRNPHRGKGYAVRT